MGKLVTGQESYGNNLSHLNAALHSSGQSNVLDSEWHLLVERDPKRLAAEKERLTQYVVPCVSASVCFDNPETRAHYEHGPCQLPACFMHQVAFQRFHN